MAAMAKNDDDAPVLSEIEARGGVTGHHVRHVLAFGLAGSVIAFVLIALYFYYAKLVGTISQLPGRIDLAKLVYFAIPLALGAGSCSPLGCGTWWRGPGQRSARP
jgi:hypothetical protein